MKQRIYIAGAITGLDEATYTENFARAERYLESYGYQPLNPCKLVDQTEGRDYNDYMHDALRHCLDADGLYMLSNWHTSKGAMAEHAIAMIYGKSIWYEGTNIQGMPEERKYQGAPRKVKAEYLSPGVLRLLNGYKFYLQDIGQPVEFPDGGVTVFISNLLSEDTASVSASSPQAYYSLPYFNSSWVEIKRVPQPCKADKPEPPLEIVADTLRLGFSYAVDTLEQLEKERGYSSDSCVLRSLKDAKEACSSGGRGIKSKP